MLGGLKHLLEHHRPGIDVRPEARKLETGPRLDARVAGPLRLCERALEQLADTLEIARAMERIGELQAELEPFRCILGQERAGPLEQVDSGRSISSRHGPAPGGREQAATARGKT